MKHLVTDDTDFVWFEKSGNMTHRISDELWADMEAYLYEATAETALAEVAVHPDGHVLLVADAGGTLIGKIPPEVLDKYILPIS